MHSDKRTEHVIRWLIAAFLVLAFAASAFVLIVLRFDIHLGELWAEKTPAEDTAADLPADGWRYLDAGREPGAGQLWTTEHYDPKDWSVGVGRFVENGGSGTGIQALAAVAEDGTPAGSYFFRREFTVDTLDTVHAITGTVRYSDAVLVYLNGEVIFAGNVPAGGFETNQSQGCAMEPGQVHEENFLVTDLSALRAGENILAVELHQAEAAGDGAFFQMPYFNLLSEETIAQTPVTDNVFLEQGDTESQLWVNWQTPDTGSYALEYITVKEYDKLTEVEDGFHLYAASVLMGRTCDGDAGCYVYRAPIAHLKNGEEYLYRIRPLGSEAASEEMRFTAPGNNRCSFAVLGGGDAGRAMAQAEGLDFVIAGRSLTAGEGLEQARSTPVRFLPETGADSFVFQDMLVVLLGADMTDLAQQEDAVRRAMDSAMRSWTVVVGGGDNADDIRADLDVSMVIDPKGQDALTLAVDMDGPRVVE